ncbi:MAG: holo-ACP synthase [Proteobacteria bacterium]|nr:holo-ACP synthase [SAR86 cluster bacterium]MDA0345627.1 holo-ACP synthase [Pseudomonadota bacterium]MDA0899730.1 holo-ACP synthase [Pseudomonadota bacterium]
MIKGIGADLVERSRVAALLSKYGQKFLNKILSKDEIFHIGKCSNEDRLNFICSSFAAKEAFVKALGTGFRGIYPNQITYLKNDKGKPSLKIENPTNYSIHLSISNAGGYTLSFIVLEE